MPSQPSTCTPAVTHIISRSSPHPTHCPPRPGNRPVGIINPNVLCYAIAVIQVLRHLSHLFVSPSGDQIADRDSILNDGFVLILLDFIFHFEGSSIEILNLTRKTPHWNLAGQQDANEFFLAVVAGITEELGADNPLDNAFRFVGKYTKTCDVCGLQSDKVQSHLVLNVPIVRAHGGTTASLQDLVDRLTTTATTETISKKCDKCTINCSHTGHFFINHLGASLLINVGRFARTEGSHHRLDNAISVPLVLKLHTKVYDAIEICVFTPMTEYSTSMSLTFLINECRPSPPHPQESDSNVEVVQLELQAVIGHSNKEDSNRLSAGHYTTGVLSSGMFSFFRMCTPDRVFLTERLNIILHVDGDVMYICDDDEIRRIDGIDAVVAQLDAWKCEVYMAFYGPVGEVGYRM